MARIPLTSGFTICPEGTYTFTVSKVEYDETFGTLRIFFAAEGGQKHDERYNLLNQDGSPNDKAMNAFSFLAKNILGNFDATDVDPDELVGRKITAEITHTEAQGRNGVRTYAHLANVAPAAAGEYNLDDLL